MTFRTTKLKRQLMKQAKSHYAHMHISGIDE